MRGRGSRSRGRGRGRGRGRVRVRARVRIKVRVRIRVRIRVQLAGAYISPISPRLTSMPRAATSVTTSSMALRARKRASAILRAAGSSVPA